jgi:hypothetical protein
MSRGVTENGAPPAAQLESTLLDFGGEMTQIDTGPAHDAAARSRGTLPIGLSMPPSAGTTSRRLWSNFLIC